MALVSRQSDNIQRWDADRKTRRLDRLKPWRFRLKYWGKLWLPGDDGITKAMQHHWPQPTLLASTQIERAKEKAREDREHREKVAAYKQWRDHPMRAVRDKKAKMRLYAEMGGGWGGGLDNPFNSLIFGEEVTLGLPPAWIREKGWW